MANQKVTISLDRYIELVVAENDLIGLESACKRAAEGGEKQITIDTVLWFTGLCRGENKPKFEEFKELNEIDEGYQE